jgi:hypothetical protein
MTTAEMVTYAYDQIDHARAALNAVSKSADPSSARPPAKPANVFGTDNFIGG